MKLNKGRNTKYGQHMINNENVNKNYYFLIVNFDACLPNEKKNWTK